MRLHRLLLAVVLSLFWAQATYAPIGCGTPTSPSGQSEITVSPNPLRFTVPRGTALTQVLNISEVGLSTDRWSAVPTVIWLSVNPASANMPTNGRSGMFVTANAGSLTPGEYAGGIQITPARVCNNNATPGITVIARVVLTVTEPPTIALSSNSLTFTAQQGGPNPPSQTVTLSNSGGGVMDWFATPAAAWLAVSPASGVGAAVLNISVNISGLTEGTYTGIIEVTATAATNTPQRINVTLVVTPAGNAVIALNPSSLQFAAQVGVNPAPKTFEIRNAGTGALGWTATASASWLSVSPTTGVAPSAVTVSVNSASLSAGTHNGSITIQALASANATNSPQVLPVTLSVGVACNLPEPPLNINLQPGFHIAEVRLTQGASEGYWGMEFLAPRGVLSGGFNLGGGVQENGATPAFGAFLVPGRQTVRVSLAAQVVPGGDASRLSLAVRLLNSARQPIGTDQFGRDFVQFDRTLDEGFYIIEVRTGAGSPRANFQLGLNADAFAGGVNVGGFLGPGQVGFGGFFLPEPQEVSIKTQGLPTFAGVGAGCLQITLLDADRRVIRTVP